MTTRQEISAHTQNLLKYLSPLHVGRWYN